MERKRNVPGRVAFRRATAWRGFTLVELLVVVGIIALLIAILLPSLSGARTQAYTVQCASNQRQIAVGWTMYANNNRGIGAPGRMARLSAPSDNAYWVGNGYQFRPRWFVTLGAETGMHAFHSPSPLSADDNTKTIDNPVFLCPQEPERTNNRNYTYGYNFQFIGNSRTSSGRYINFPVKASRLHGSETVMFADALGTAAGKPLAQRTAYRVDGAQDDNASGNHAWSLDPPRITGAANSEYCNDNTRRPESRSAPDMRHRKKANVAYVDGHSALATLAELGYVQEADGRVSINGSGAHNRLFSGTTRDDDPPPIP